MGHILLFATRNTLSHPFVRRKMSTLSNEVFQISSTMSIKPVTRTVLFILVGLITQTGTLMLKRKLSSKAMKVKKRKIKVPKDLTMPSVRISTFILVMATLGDSYAVLL